MEKNLTILGITLTMAAISCSPTYAKKIYPAEILGRDLLFPGLGWTGHVGIATTDMMSPAGMNKNADQVIEVLDENPVGQINTLAILNFAVQNFGVSIGVVNME